MTNETAESLPAHDYYAGLSRRFDRRISTMNKMGFVCRRNEMYYRQYSRRRVNVSLVMHADRRCWIDELVECVREGKSR